MKRNKDEGLRYIQKIGISRVKSWENLCVLMDRALGEECAEKYLNGRPEGEGIDFFEYKNSNEKAATLYTGSFDADIIRKAVNWVNAHKEAFGEEILEIGCDIGFMTGFLALAFPESRIIAIDKSSNGILLAKKLTDRIGVKNVEYICTSLEDLDESLKFDTVFSMRCLYANMMDVGMEERTFDLFRNDMLNYMISSLGYFSEVYKHVKLNGTLVSIMNTGLNPLSASWMLMNEINGFVVDYDSYQGLVCDVLDGKQELQAFYSRYLEENEAEMTDAQLKGELQKHIRVTSFILDKLQTSDEDAEYHGWLAELIRDDQIKDLVQGFILKDAEGKIAGKFGVYTSCIDETAVLQYQAMGEFTLLRRYDISHLEEIKRNIQDAMELKLEDFRDLVRNKGYTMWRYHFHPEKYEEYVGQEDRIH